MTEKKTLKEVLEQFEYVGNTIYNGKFEDNILNIFTELSESEKRVLLYSVYNLLCIMTLPPEEQKVPARPKKPQIEEESDEEVYNQELDAFKAWIIKFLFGSLIVGVVCTLMVTVLLSLHKTFNGEGSTFFSVIKLLFE